MPPTVDPETLARSITQSTPEARGPAAWAALDAVGWPRDSTILPLPEQLTPAQRQVAEALARVTGVPLSQYPIPQYVQIRRRWLGLDEPSLLEQSIEVTGRRLPRWKALADLGGTILPEPAEALLPDPVERLQAFAEIELWQPYGIGLPQGTIGLAEEVGAAAAPWAERFADELLAIPPAPTAQLGETRWSFQPPPSGMYEHPSRPAGIATLFATLIPLVRAHGVLAPRYYGLLPAFRHPALAGLLAAVAESDREQVFLGLVQRALAPTAVDIAIALLPAFPYPRVAEEVRQLLASPVVASTFGTQKLKRQKAAWAALCTEHTALAAFAKPAKKAK